MIRRILGAVTALCLFLAPLAGAQGEASAPITREEALAALMDIPSADFTLRNLDGEDVTLSELKGKIVVLSIWATWCEPCQFEMPFFEAVNAREDDVVVLAVHSIPLETGLENPSDNDIKQAALACREFIAEKEFTFPVLLDTYGEVSRSETYIMRGIPGNFIIDKEGIIRYAQEGAYPSEEFLMQALDFVRALDAE